MTSNEATPDTNGHLAAPKATQTASSGSELPQVTGLITSSKPSDATEAAALDQLKDRLEKAGLYQRPEGDLAASHPDVTLIRFLRARKGNVEGAFKQFQSTEKWRKDNRVDHKFEECDLEKAAALKDVYPQWTGRTDRLGIPLYVHEMKRFTPEAMKPIEGLSDKERLDLEAMFHEELMRIAGPYCGPNVVTTTSIVDVGGSGLTDFWRLRKHFQWSTSISSSYYPETLGVIFVVNAPSFFSKVWSFISGWLDKGTQEKVHVLSDNAALTRWIAPENLPKQYGGELDWRPSQEPNWDPAKGEPQGWYGQTVGRVMQPMNGKIPEGGHGKLRENDEAKAAANGTAEATA